ncbi:MAG: hypothetical protein DRP85_07220, partial [Candidatus Makaraimicrobium thalassicum]
QKEKPEIPAEVTPVSEDYSTPGVATPGVERLEPEPEPVVAEEVTPEEIKAAEEGITVEGIKADLHRDSGFLWWGGTTPEREEAARKAILLLLGTKDPGVQKKIYKLGKKAVKRMKKEGKDEILKYTLYEFALEEAYRLIRDEFYEGNVTEAVSSILDGVEVIPHRGSYDGIRGNILDQGTLTEAGILTLVLTSNNLVDDRLAVDLATISYLKENGTRGIFGNFKLWIGLGYDTRAESLSLGAGASTKLLDRGKDARVAQGRANIGNKQAAYYAATVELLRSFFAYYQEAYQLTAEIAKLKKGVEDLEAELNRAKDEDKPHIKSRILTMQGIIDTDEARFGEVKEGIRSLMGLEPGEAPGIDFSRPFSEDGIDSLDQMCARYGIRLGMPSALIKANAGAVWAGKVKEEADIRGVREIGVSLRYSLLNVMESWGLTGLTGSIDVKWENRISRAHADFLTAVKAMYAEAEREKGKVRAATLKSLETRAKALLKVMDQYIDSLEKSKREYEAPAKRWSSDRYNYFQTVFDLQHATTVRNEVERQLKDILAESGLEYEKYGEAPEAAERMNAESVVEGVLESASQKGDIAELELAKQRDARELERLGIVLDEIKEKGKMSRWERFRNFWRRTGSRSPLGLGSSVSIGVSITDKLISDGYGWMQDISEPEEEILTLFANAGIELRPDSALGLWEKYWKLSHEEADKRIQHRRYIWICDAVSMVNNYRALEVQLKSAEKQLEHAENKLREVMTDQGATREEAASAERERTKAMAFVLEKEFQLEQARGQIASALGEQFPGMTEKGSMTTEEAGALLERSLSAAGLDGYDPAGAQLEILKLARERTLVLLRLAQFKKMKVPVSMVFKEYKKEMPRRTTARDYSGNEIINPLTGQPFTINEVDAEENTVMSYETEDIFQYYADWIGILESVVERGMSIKKAAADLDRSEFNLKSAPSRIEEARGRAVDACEETRKVLKRSILSLKRHEKALEDIERRFKEHDPAVTPRMIMDKQKKVEGIRSEVSANESAAANAMIQVRRIAGPDYTPAEEIEEGEVEYAIRELHYRRTASVLESTDLYLRTITGHIDADGQLLYETYGIKDQIKDVEDALAENAGWQEYESKIVVVDPDTGTVSSYGRPEVIAELKAAQAELEDRLGKLEDVENRQIWGMDWKIDIKIRPFALLGDAGKKLKKAEDAPEVVKQAEYAFALKMIREHSEVSALRKKIAGEKKLKEELQEFRRELLLKQAISAEPAILDRIKAFTEEIAEVEKRIDAYKAELRDLEIRSLEGLKYLADQGILDLAYVDKAGETRPVDLSEMSPDLYEKLMEEAMKKWPDVRRHVIAADISEMNVRQFSIPRKILSGFEVRFPFGSREASIRRAQFGIYINIIEPGKAYRKDAEQVALWINQAKIDAAQKDFRGTIYRLENSMREYAEAMIRHQAAYRSAEKSLNKALENWADFDPNASIVLGEMRFAMREARNNFIDATRGYNQALLELQVYLHALGEDRAAFLDEVMTGFTPEETAAIISGPAAVPEAAEARPPKPQWEIEKALFDQGSLDEETEGFLDAVLGKGRYEEEDVTYWAGFFAYLSQSNIRDYTLNEAKVHINGMTWWAKQLLPRLKDSEGKDIDIPDFFGRCVDPYSFKHSTRYNPLIGLLDFAASYEEYVIARGQESLDQAASPIEARKRANKKMDEVIDALERSDSRYLEGLKAGIDEKGLGKHPDEWDEKLVMMKPYGDDLIENITGQKRDIATGWYDFRDRRILANLYGYTVLHALTPEQTDDYYSNVLPGLIGTAKVLIGDSLEGGNIRNLPHGQSDYLKWLYAQLEGAPERDKERLRGWIDSYEEMMRENLILDRALTLLTVAMENAEELQTTVEDEVTKMNYIAEVVQALDVAEGAPADIDPFLTVISTFNDTEYNKSTGKGENVPRINTVLRGKKRTAEVWTGRLGKDGKFKGSRVLTYGYTKEGNLKKITYDKPFIPTAKDTAYTKEAREFAKTHKGITYSGFKGTAYNGGPWTIIIYKDGTVEKIIEGTYGPEGTYVKEVSGSGIPGENLIYHYRKGHLIKIEYRIQELGKKPLQDELENLRNSLDLSGLLDIPMPQLEAALESDMFTSGKTRTLREEISVLQEIINKAEWAEAAVKLEDIIRGLEHNRQIARSTGAPAVNREQLEALQGLLEKIHQNAEYAEVTDKRRVVKEIAYDDPANPRLQYSVGPDKKIYVSKYDAKNKKTGDLVKEVKGVTIQDGKVLDVEKEIVVARYDAPQEFTKELDLPEMLSADLAGIKPHKVIVRRAIEIDESGKEIETGVSYIFRNSEEKTVLSLGPETIELKERIGDIEDPSIYKAWVSFYDDQGKVRKSYGFIGTISPEGNSIKPYEAPPESVQETEERHFAEYPLAEPQFHDSYEFEYDYRGRVGEVTGIIWNPITGYKTVKEEKRTYNAEGRISGRNITTIVNNTPRYRSEFRFTKYNEEGNPVRAEEKRVHLDKYGKTVMIEGKPKQDKFVSIIQNYGVKCGEEKETWFGIEERKANKDYYLANADLWIGGKPAPLKKKETTELEDGRIQIETTVYTYDENGTPETITTEVTIDEKKARQEIITFTEYEKYTGPDKQERSRPVWAVKEVREYDESGQFKNYKDKEDKPTDVKKKEESLIRYDKQGEMVWHGIKAEYASGDYYKTKMIDGKPVMVNGKPLPLEKRETTVVEEGKVRVKTTVYTYDKDNAPESVKTEVAIADQKAYQEVITFSNIEKRDKEGKLITPKDEKGRPVWAVKETREYDKSGRFKKYKDKEEKDTEVKKSEESLIRYDEQGEMVWHGFDVIDNSTGEFYKAKMINGKVVPSEKKEVLISADGEAEKRYTTYFYDEDIRVKSMKVEVKRKDVLKKKEVITKTEVMTFDRWNILGKPIHAKKVINPENPSEIRAEWFEINYTQSKADPYIYEEDWMLYQYCEGTVEYEKAKAETRKRGKRTETLLEKSRDFKRKWAWKKIEIWDGKEVTFEYVEYYRWDGTRLYHIRKNEYIEFSKDIKKHEKLSRKTAIKLDGDANITKYDILSVFIYDPESRSIYEIPVGEGSKEFEDGIFYEGVIDEDGEYGRKGTLLQKAKYRWVMEEPLKEPFKKFITAKTEEKPEREISIPPKDIPQKEDRKTIELYFHALDPVKGHIIYIEKKDQKDKFWMAGFDEKGEFGEKGELVIFEEYLGDLEINIKEETMKVDDKEIEKDRKNLPNPDWTFGHVSKDEIYMRAYEPDEKGYYEIKIGRTVDRRLKLEKIVLGFVGINKKSHKVEPGSFTVVLLDEGGCILLDEKGKARLTPVEIKLDKGKEDEEGELKISIKDKKIREKFKIAILATVTEDGDQIRTKYTDEKFVPEHRRGHTFVALQSAPDKTLHELDRNGDVRKRMAYEGELICSHDLKKDEVYVALARNPDRAIWQVKGVTVEDVEDVEKAGVLTGTEIKLSVEEPKAVKSVIKEFLERVNKDSQMTKKEKNKVKEYIKRIGGEASDITKIKESVRQIKSELSVELKGLAAEQKRKKDFNEYAGGLVQQLKNKLIYELIKIRAVKTFGYDDEKPELMYVHDISEKKIY